MKQLGDAILVSVADLAPRNAVGSPNNRLSRYPNLVATTCSTGFELNPIMKSLTTCVTFLLTLIFISSSVSAQDLKQLQDDYDAKLEVWRETVKELLVTRFKYDDALDERSAKELRRQWESLREKGRVQLDEVVTAATELFTHSEDPPQDLIFFMSGLQGKILADGKPRKAYDIGQLLLKILPEDENVQRTTARAAIRTNRFDEAAKLSASAGTSFYNGLGQHDTRMFEALPDIQAKYQRELDLRELDAKADNLPQVRFNTTQGEIVVELYVNQAPSTVANILKVVEEKKYDGMTFNMVAKDMVAMSGQLYKDGTISQTPYTIVDECEREDARHHFYGTLSIARSAEIPDSGYMQFYICNLPMSLLDGERTVFGRIISGFENFEKLTFTHENNDDNTQTPLPNVRPDHIISAEVIRKPEGEYKIQKSK